MMKFSYVREENVAGKGENAGGRVKEANKVKKWNELWFQKRNGWKRKKGGKEHFYITPTVVSGLSKT